MVVIVIVERNAGVLALDEAPAGRIVLSCGKRQPGIFGKRINGLDQAFAKGGLASDQAAVMVLNGAGNDLRC